MSTSTSTGPFSDDQCPDLADVRVAFGLNLTLNDKSALNALNTDQHECEYARNDGRTYLLVDYSFNTTADAFAMGLASAMDISRSAGADPPMTLSGLGDEAYSLQSIPSAPLTTTVDVLKGTTQISATASTDLSTVEAFVRGLLSKPGLH